MRFGRRSSTKAVHVAVRVQAHPARAFLLPELLSTLDPLPVEVSTHSSDPPSPWAGYQQAIADPPDCSHLLVLQDDTLPCRNFPRAVTLVAEAKRHHLVSLFLAWLPAPASKQALRAEAAGSRYCMFMPSNFVPAVALLWPLDVLERFKEWVAVPGRSLPGHRGFVASDDAVLGKWHKATSETIWVTCPSLVEHPDIVDSVKGRQEAVWGKAKGRCAASYIGDRDPLQLDWL